MWYLVVASEHHQGKRVRLAGEKLTIGRGEDAQIRIGSEEVSRLHCELEPQEGGVLIRDLESRNGTLVDGVPIPGEKLLVVGALITVGPMTFELMHDEAGSKPPPSGRVHVPRKGEPLKLSDDAVASWLSDSEIPAGADTTISGSPAEATVAEEAPPPVSTGPKPPPPSKQRFDSVSEEAADIIRRHREYLKLLAEAEGGDQS